MHPLFFLPVFYLKTPTARVWTAASLQPLCLLAASLCFATPNMMKRAFWGVRWGDWSYSAFPTLRLCVWTLWWNLCLLPFSLRRKLYLCVCHVLTTQQTHRRCTYKLVLTFIVMHTHTCTLQIYMDLMMLSSRSPWEQAVLTKQNRCLCAQCHPNVSSHALILCINHTVPLFGLQFLFSFDVPISVLLSHMG